jgi:hypothetical protein
MACRSWTCEAAVPEFENSLQHAMLTCRLGGDQQQVRRGTALTCQLVAAHAHSPGDTVDGVDVTCKAANRSTAQFGCLE